MLLARRSRTMRRSSLARSLDLRRKWRCPFLLWSPPCQRTSLVQPDQARLRGNSCWERLPREIQLAQGFGGRSDFMRCMTSRMLSATEALLTLSSLRGQTQEVLSGIALLPGRPRGLGGEHPVLSLCRFRRASRDLLADHLSTLFTNAHTSRLPLPACEGSWVQANAMLRQPHACSFLSSGMVGVVVRLASSRGRLGCISLHFGSRLSSKARFVGSTCFITINSECCFVEARGCSQASR